MSTKSLQPLKGFWDRYPEDMAMLNKLFETVKSVAALCGFQQYDGPLVEPIELYVGKTSRELLEDQAFTLPDKKGNTLMLRPEITPSLARMVAAKAQELPLPIRYFNIGLRYRYEAPQRGRNREFYQIDFDIIGSDSTLADIEILNVVAQLFEGWGATENDFTIYINSRELMNTQLSSFGLSTDQNKMVLSAIDKKDKVELDTFKDMLQKAELTDDQITSVIALLDDPSEYAQQFEDLLAIAKDYGIEKYIEVNPLIVRGLDYYTGLVFEVKSKGTLVRSLLGGGRYNNLVGMFDEQSKLPGIGFAASDTVVLEFLKEIGKTPEVPLTTSQVLVTIFDESTISSSLKITQQIRSVGIACQMYPDVVKLPKQLKYANRIQIPYVIVIGPDEQKKQSLILKNMQTGDQEELQQSQITQRLTQLVV